MATINSASLWSDGANCRNQRAPRMADIQRHKAVETGTNTTQNLPPTATLTAASPSTPVVTSPQLISNNFESQAIASLLTPISNIKISSDNDDKGEDGGDDEEKINTRKFSDDLVNKLDSDILTTSSSSHLTKKTSNMCDNITLPNSLPAYMKNLPKTQSLDLDPEDGHGSASHHHHHHHLASSEMKGIFPKLQLLDQSRPIYPNVPYSPYGSPRTNRRRTPLRESRRVSIEQTGSFLQLNQYKLLDQIGQGSYGLVKLAYSEEDSTHYAMKILSKRKLVRKAGLLGKGPRRGTTPLDRVYREIAVLKKLDHPNVVKLVEVLDDPIEDSLYLVFELVQQGEILSVPTDRPLTEERARSVFIDTILGVEYLHYQKIIHGDLKPANLLLDECGRVKVADLGVCNEFLDEDAVNSNSTSGTPAFRAPETLLGDQRLYSGKAADIWALGVTLFSLVYGNVPFYALYVPAVYEKIKNSELVFPKTITVSEDLQDLILKLLTKDPNMRITLPQIKEHKWVTVNGMYPLPSEEENCRLVQINDEDIISVVKSIPKLDTLILIKTMLKKHSFQNPFSKSASTTRSPQPRSLTRLERFSRSGRSNSAPGDYHGCERNVSTENLLPSVVEGVCSSNNSEASEQQEPN